MKKGTRLACVVGLASIALVMALTGGASAAKIGDREVTARNIANGSIHCRALDKYLKGHLCGPNATVKKGGVGPQGPPGPPGPSGGGATEVFYAASAPNGPVTIFPNDVLTLRASCSTAQGAELDLEMTTTKSGVLRTAAVTGDNLVEYNNVNLGPTAAAPAPFVFGEALLTLSYITADGDVLTGTFQVDSDTNGALNATRDCVVAGHMNVS